ncbi:MAG: histidine phosphatase family protein, partial [Clostridiales bacterium]|nr:histidine phosphatase family protein [Clostridiales bacterium]
VFDRIYTSPLRRAIETGQIIAERTLKGGMGGGQIPVGSTGAERTPADGVTAENFIVDPHLIEMNFGSYEGQILRDIRKLDRNIDNCFTVPSLFVADERGEDFYQVCERINDFIDSVLLPLEGGAGTVLIVCHGTVVRAFLHRMDGLAIDDFWNISQPNCCINHLRLENGRFSMIERNIFYYDRDTMKNRGIL